jgi:hypothetical protein
MNNKANQLKIRVDVHVNISLQHSPVQSDANNSSNFWKNVTACVNLCWHSKKRLQNWRIGWGLKINTKNQACTHEVLRAAAKIRPARPRGRLWADRGEGGASGLCRIWWLPPGAPTGGLCRIRWLPGSVRLKFISADFDYFNNILWGKISRNMTDKFKRTNHNRLQRGILWFVWLEMRSKGRGITSFHSFLPLLAGTLIWEYLDLTS